MRVLITGATGFIGHNLCEMVSKVHQVQALGRSVNTEALSYQSMIIPDLAEKINWVPYLAGVDCVIHLAGIAHQSNISPERMYQINTVATKHLLAACVEAKVKRFIFLSSIAVYGLNASSTVLSVETPAPNPSTPYGHSKWLAEQLVWQCCATHNVEGVIIRPPLVYGKNAPGNIAALNRALKKHIPLPFANVNNKRSMVYVKNLTACITHCITHPGAIGNTFLVSDGLSISTKDFLCRLAAKGGVKPYLFSMPIEFMRATLTLLNKKAIFNKLWGDLCIDSTETGRLLDWQPPFTVDAAWQNF